MPSPVAHLYYSQAYLERHPVSERGAFMRGCVFPDIRYFAQIDRAVTHRRDVSLSQVEEESDAWKAGWLFHSWLDIAWTDYFEQFGINPEDDSFDTKRSALKMLEDDQMRGLLKQEQVNEMSAALRSGDEGTNMGVSAHDVIAWYGLVDDLVLAKDSIAARERLLSAMHVSSKVVRRLERHEVALRKERVWQDRAGL